MSDNVWVLRNMSCSCGMANPLTDWKNHVPTCRRVMCNAAADELEALRGVVDDMLSGLAYLRSTKTIPYGFGIDRLEQTGNAARGHQQSPSTEKL